MKKLVLLSIILFLIIIILAGITLNSYYSNTKKDDLLLEKNFQENSTLDTNLTEEQEAETVKKLKALGYLS